MVTRILDVPPLTYNYETSMLYVLAVAVATQVGTQYSEDWSSCDGMSSCMLVLGLIGLLVVTVSEM